MAMDGVLLLVTVDTRRPPRMTQAYSSRPLQSRVVGPIGYSGFAAGPFRRGSTLTGCRRSTGALRSADGYAEGSASAPAHHARPHSPRIRANVRRRGTNDLRPPLASPSGSLHQHKTIAKVEAICQVDKKESRTSPIIPASSSESPESSPRPTKRPRLPFVVCAPPPPFATRPQVDDERDWRYEVPLPLQSTGRRRRSAK
ncbi:hypothetical protein B0H13DRAFT_50973 [Mycena leptocephala]|nr:hypothetical protein B0H13DRAFT_50973 [Mycena leptocephala]